MAQSYTADNGQTLILPGAYVDQQVIAGQGGIAASGIATLVGEADEGPGFAEELDLNSNVFGPDALNAVIQKYGSGRLVEAFKAISSAANDPNIVGSVSAVKLVKTNASQKAQAILSRAGFGDYATLPARRAGMPGNLIKYRSEVSVAEIEPQTGTFSYVPHYSGSSVVFTLRSNGRAAKSITNAAVTVGATFISSIEDQSLGLLAQGGTDPAVLTGKSGGAISCAPLGSSTDTLVITIAGTIATANQPAVGDTLIIPESGEFGAAADSAILGASDDNRGAYIITAFVNGGSNSLITAKRINAPSGAPSVVSDSGTIDAGLKDIIIIKKVNVRNVTGMDRQSTVGLSAVTFTTSVNASGSFTMGLSTNWAHNPSVGDYCLIGSTFAGITAGFYQVTAVGANSFSATRLSNGTSGSTGSATVSGPITQGAQPFTILKPVIDGLGKSLEVVGSVGSIMFDSTTLAPVAFGNTEIVSQAEYKNATTISRDAVSDTFIAGGEIVLKVGSTEASATMVIDSSKVDFKVGATTVFSASFKQFPTLQNLVDRINTQTGFKAVLVAQRFALLSASDLDRGTFNISATSLSYAPGRIKHDADLWSDAVAASGLVSNEIESQSGLPETVSPDQFLSGGTKAGTTGADVVAALSAAEQVDTNFVNTLFSADASSDITEGETESDSTYTIDAVNLALRSHIIAMSQYKARKFRIGLCGRSGTYAAIKEAAGQLSSFRMAMAFQDVRMVALDGSIKQFQPWMAAVVAAGMQAAAGYKGIVKKFANISGIVKPENDFDPGRPSNLEDALKSGLLILERVPTGGFRWVSDQTTYSIDNNFVYNSLQAVYVADIMSLTLIQNFDRAFVGKSVAEISAAGALAFLDSEMFNFRRLRFIAASDDAPKGYKNASVRINGGVMNVSLEAKLAGLLYFVPIQFQLSQVQQSANQ